MIILLHLFIKIVVLFLLLMLIYFYDRNKLIKKYKLSIQRQVKYKSYVQYKIYDHNELDISLCIIYLYVIFLIFICLLFNINNVVDFKPYYNKLIFLSMQIPVASLFINILLFFCLLKIYFIILSLVTNNVKTHIYKIYFYFFNFFYDQYAIKMCTLQRVLDLNTHTTMLFNYYLDKRYTLENNAKLPRWHYFAYFHVLGLQYIFHRILLLVTISYDLIFNNMVLTHMFILLPFVFIYELWVKLSIFLAGVNFSYDNIIAKLLYSEISQIEIDKDCLYLDEEPYEKTFLKDIVTIYARNNFVDKRFLPTNPINQGLADMYNFWKNIYI